MRSTFPPICILLLVLRNFYHLSTSFYFLYPNIRRRTLWYFDVKVQRNRVQRYWAGRFNSVECMIEWEYSTLLRRVSHYSLTKFHGVMLSIYNPCWERTGFISRLGTCRYDWEFSFSSSVPIVSTKIGVRVHWVCNFSSLNPVLDIKPLCFKLLSPKREMLSAKSCSAVTITASFSQVLVRRLCRDTGCLDWCFRSFLRNMRKILGC
jgi:hypothetical protein